jgi:threonine/homoserine/homoserine lactone efflux protein
MGCGGAIFGALALFGLNALLSEVAWLYSALKLCGGAYLVYLGIRIWRGAPDPLIISNADTLASISPTRSFSIAFLTQISNPKTAFVYGSVFAALLPPVPPVWMLLVLPPLILIVETSWYALVALIFSAGGPRSIYLGCKHWIDRMMGTIMGTLGIKLIFEATKSRVS